MKKFLAVTLTLALTLALFAFPLPASAAVTTTRSTTDVLFEDNFDSYVDFGTENGDRREAMIANGWESQGPNAPFTAASSGSYVAAQENSRNMMLSIENTKDWAGYSVSGTISFSDVQEARTADVYGVFVIYANDLSEGGYETGFCLNADGTKKLLIRRRKSTVDGYSALSCISRVFDFNTDGTVYNLKAEYNAGVINCYIDGVLELSYNTSNDDIMLTKGSAGIRKVNTGAAVTFDNFKVEKAEKTVWFEENFTYGETDTIDSISGLTDADITGIKQNGALPIDFSSAHKYLINTKGTTAWNDYSIEADFAITRNEGTTQTGFFGLSGRMSDEANGYEFTIKVTNSANNKIYGRIRKLTTNSNKLLYESTEYVSFVSGDTYAIKLEFVGNTINGYVNGQLLCTATDDTFSSGTAGINIAANENSSVDVSVDNYKVSRYTPMTEYFNQTFDNTTTATTLTNAGYVAVATDDETLDTTTMATYLNNGKLSLPSDKTKLGLFAPYIDSNTYTVQTEVVIDEAPSSVGYPCGLLIGSTNKTYATGYYFEVRVNTSGTIYQIRVRKNGVVQNSINGIALDSNVTKGNTAVLKADVSYDADANQSTVTVSVISGGTVLVTSDFSVTDELKGYSAAWKNGSGGVSFDNLTAYNVNSYVSPIIGELDGDGVVTATDARYIRGYLLGTNDATSANINGDTASDIRDLVHFKKVFEFYR